MYVFMFLLCLIWITASIVKNILVCRKLLREMKEEDRANFKRMLNE